MTQLAAIPTRLEPPTGKQAAASSGARLRGRELPHYRIGPVSVSVRSDLVEVERAFHELYEPYRVHAPARGEFRIEVIAKRSPRSLRRYYHIRGNGEELFTVRHPRSVLPHVEWALNILVSRYLPVCFQIHASVMSRHGVGIILPAPCGRGKTTLAAGLLTRGWSYLSDEFALIDPFTLCLQPYPKALCVKAGSFDTLARMGLPLNTRESYLKGEKGRVAFINPLRVRRDAVADPCPVGLVVFPDYGGDAPPAIEPMSRARAVFELLRVSFSFPRFRTRGLDLLAGVVSKARCYRLRTGDLVKSCELVEACLQRRDSGEG